MSVHAIDRQVFELNCGSEQTAGRLQKELMHYTLPRLQAIIGEVLDELAGGPHFYRIESIEIDLGEWAVGEWGEREMMDQFARRFRDRLVESLRGSEGLVGGVGRAGGGVGGAGVAGGAGRVGVSDRVRVVGSEGAAGSSGNVPGSEKGWGIWKDGVFTRERSGVGKGPGVGKGSGAGNVPGIGSGPDIGSKPGIGRPGDIEEGKAEMARRELQGGEEEGDHRDAGKAGEIDKDGVPGEIGRRDVSGAIKAGKRSGGINEGGLSGAVRRPWYIRLLDAVRGVRAPEAPGVSDEAGRWGAPGVSDEAGTPGAPGVSGSVKGAGVFEGRAGERFFGTSDEVGARMLSAADLEWEMTRRFLLTGDLPWWADKAELPDMDRLFRKMIDQAPERVRDFVEESGSAEVLRRISEQYSFETRKAFRRLIGGGGGGGKDGKSGGDGRDGGGGGRLESWVPGVKEMMRRWGMEKVVRWMEGRLPEPGGAMEAGRVMVAGKVTAPGSVTGVGKEMETGRVIMRGNGMSVGKKKLLEIRRRLMARPALLALLLLRLPPELGGLAPGTGELGGLPGRRHRERRILENIVANSGGVEVIGRRLEPGEGSLEKEEGRVREEERTSKADLVKVEGSESIGAMDNGGDLPGGVITAGEKKVLAAAVKKIVPRAVVLLDDIVRLPVEKVRDLLSSELMVTTIADKEPSGEETQRALIENAGLCLFAPYLSSFFTNLGYIKEDQFKDKSAVYKAIFLLQYIATGNKKAPEYLLPLNKLLCGLPADEAVPAAVRLTKKEITEADDLVQAVLENWKALKGTSMDGLRGSFLCRKGIITDKGAHWVLQVERKEYDLLLNGLPWRYSLVKLPWMDKRLEVEW